MRATGPFVLSPVGNDSEHIRRHHRVLDEAKIVIVNVYVGRILPPKDEAIPVGILSEFVDVGAAALLECRARSRVSGNCLPLAVSST